MTFHLNLETETVEHAYTKPPLCVDVNGSVRDAVKTMNAARRGGTIVVDADGKAIGVLTERDVLRVLAAGESLDQPIRDVMTSPAITVHPSDTVGHAITLMAEGGYRRLPIVDESGKAVGAITVSGILHYLVEHFPEIVYTLPPTPRHWVQQREGA